MTFGCDDTTVNNYTILQTSPLNVVAFIYTYYRTSDSSHYSEADVIVRNHDTIPLIRINDIEPTDLGYNEGYYYPVLFNPGTACSLDVNVGVRSMHAVTKVPDEFHVITPAENDLVVGRDLSIVWSNAKADRYDIFIQYQYYDGVDTWYGYWTTITDVIDTSKVLTNFLPELPVGAVWQYGFVGVIAINGPRLQAGTPGNITGDGFGFCWTYNYSKGSHFNNSSSQSINISDIEESYIKNYQKDLKKRLLTHGFLNN